MWGKLKQKWKVNTLSLVLILTTFAIGGSITGWLARKLLSLVGTFESRAVYITVYIVVVTLLWPIVVLLVSVFFGQFTFFKNYIKKIFGRLKFNKH